MAQNSRKNGRERRDALLDAALQCFAKKGLLETGIEDVRKAAGASPSSVYHLFGGMHDLVVGLLERTIERLYGALNEAAVEPVTAEALVHALVTAHLDWVLANRSEARFLYQALSLELAASARKHLGRMKAELKVPLRERLVELGMQALDSWPPSMLEVVVLGPSHQACRWLLMGGPVDEAWIRRELPAIAWRSVGGVSRESARARAPRRPAAPRRARR